MSKGIDLSYAKPEQKSSLPTFNIITHRGTLGDVTLRSGRKVGRVDGIYVPTHNATIKCAPYDNHFIYELIGNERIIGAPPTMCTCGSMAMVVGHDAYKNDASPQGQMFVCLYHANTGKHADGGQ